MGSLFFLIPLSLIILGAAFYLLLWAIRSGQYDDLDSPAYDVISDDEKPEGPC